MRKYFPFLICRLSFIEKGIYLLLIFSFIGILFFPRYYLSPGAKIRLEDVCFIFLFPLIFLKLFTLQKKILLAPLFLWFYIFCISLVRNIDYLTYILIFAGKALHYYVIMLSVFFVFQKGKIKLLLLCITISIIIQDVWGLYQLITKHFVGYYAICAIFYSDSPSLSGQIYMFGLIFSCFMLFFHLVDDKWIPLFKLLIIASFFCCLLIHRPLFPPRVVLLFFSAPIKQ